MDDKEILAQTKHERDMLAKAIGNAAIKAGIIRPDVSLTGPMLVMVCGNLADLAKSKSLESEAKQVLKMPAEKRREHYGDVLENRGPEVLKELLAEIRKPENEIADDTKKHKPDFDKVMATLEDAKVSYQAMADEMEPTKDDPVWAGGYNQCSGMADAFKAAQEALNGNFWRLNIYAGKDGPSAEEKETPPAKDNGISAKSVTPEQAKTLLQSDAHHVQKEVEKLLEMHPDEMDKIVGTRTAVLINQLTDAEFNLNLGWVDPEDYKHIKSWERDKKHAEHGLKNIAKGKTLESEVENVLKMGSKARHEYYTEVLKSGGRKAVDELTSAVKKQRSKSNALEM